MKNAKIIQIYHQMGFLKNKLLFCLSNDLCMELGLQTNNHKLLRLLSLRS